MRVLGNERVPSAKAIEAGFRSLEIDKLITTVADTSEARALPPGSFVGDQHGGLTFSDAVAAVLESRSFRGWQEIESPDGRRWTIIRIDK